MPRKYLKKASSRTNDLIAYQEALDKWASFKLNSYQVDLQAMAKPLPTSKSKSFAVEDKNNFPKDSVAYAIHNYIHVHTQKQYEARQITKHTIKTRRQSLSYFTNVFLKQPGTKSGATTVKDSGINKQLTEHRMIRLYEHFNNVVHKKETMALATAKTRHSIIKRFVHWTWENRYLDELPRNVFSRYLVVKKVKGQDGESKMPPNRIFTKDEIKLIFDTASNLPTNQPLILFILLSLNTAMSFIDIGTLQHKHITLDSDGIPTIIKRQRSKTGQSGRWVLWNETANYLKTHLDILASQKVLHRSISSEPYVFLQNDRSRMIMKPQPLMYSLTASSPDKYKAAASITMLMLRLRKESGLTKPMKCLRASSGNAIRTLSDNDIILTQMFLSHLPKTVAEKNYTVATNFTSLDRYVDAMYSYFQIDDFKSTIHASQARYKEMWR